MHPCRCVSPRAAARAGIGRGARVAARLVRSGGTRAAFWRGDAEPANREGRLCALDTDTDTGTAKAQTQTQTQTHTQTKTQTQTQSQFTDTDTDTQICSTHIHTFTDIAPALPPLQERRSAAMRVSSGWRRPPEGHARSTRAGVLRSSADAGAGRRRLPAQAVEDGRPERGSARVVRPASMSAGSRAGAQTDARMDVGRRRGTEHPASGRTRRGPATSEAARALQPSNWYSRLSPSLMIGRKPLSVCAHPLLRVPFSALGRSAACSAPWVPLRVQVQAISAAHFSRC